MLLGLHTYSLNLHGIGQAWDAGFKLPWPRQITTFELFNKILDLDLEGVHLDDGVLEHLDVSYLKEVGAAATEKGLYIEYNFSLDLGGKGIGIQHDLEEAITIAHALGSDIVKMSLDLSRPRPVAASRFHPDVMKRIGEVATLLRTVVPMAGDAGVRIAVENHCDTFSEEILWLLDEVGSSRVGACIDTVNAFHVTEDPMTAVRNLAPRAFTNHFRDNRIEFKRYGFKLTGTAVGEGDLDMKDAYEIIRAQPAMERINIETDLDIPLNDRETALELEIDAIKRSVRYCRNVLGIGKNRPEH